MKFLKIRKYLFIFLFIIFGAIGTLDMGANKAPLINKEEVILTPSKDLYFILESLNVKHPDIVYAQAILETGNFTSEYYKKYHNMMGFGGHAMCVIGYDDRKDGGAFEIMNSWGTDWGQNGYFMMPYSYAANPNLCSDFWVLTK